MVETEAPSPGRVGLPRTDPAAVVETRPRPKGAPPPAAGRRISVVLPAYNEEENVARQVAAVDEACRELGFEDWEILVVDDGSTDRTRAVIEAMDDEYPKLRLLVHEVNRGYAQALATGFGAARHPLLFYTDADNQFDVRELEHFLPAIDENDLVCGFRIYRFDPFSRLVLSWGYNLLVRILFRIRVRDVDCAFKLFRREIFDRITIRSRKFFVDTEILAKASKLQLRMVEIGVRHYPRTAGESTVRPSHVLSTLVEIAEMWTEIHVRGRV